MPTFDSSTVTVEGLDWDFHGFGVKAKGTVPEPSDAAIGKFLDDLKALYTKAQGEGLTPDADATTEQMMDAVMAVTGDKFVTFMADMAGLFATLCGDKPSKENLLALPMRVRVKFYGWVQQEVVNPEADPGDGNAVVRALPSAHAG